MPPGCGRGATTAVICRSVPLVGYKLGRQGQFRLDAAKRRAADAGVRRGFRARRPIAAKAETSLDAPVVFVGYGIVAPDYKRDDYAGVDVKGKIVAYVGGAPDGL